MLFAPEAAQKAGQQFLMSNESWVAIGVLVTVYALGKLIPIIVNAVKALRTPEPARPAPIADPAAASVGSSADASGTHPAVEHLPATQQELSAVKAEVGRVRADVNRRLDTFDVKLDKHAENSAEKISELAVAIGRLEGRQAAGE